MDLIWRAGGWVRLRLTSGDCARRLRELSREIRIEGIDFRSDVTVEFLVARRDVGRISVREGEKLERIGSGGGPKGLCWILQWRITAAMLLALLVLTWFLPSRIWFIRVEGNGDLPARLILEEAQNAGIRFGASRRGIRSEQVKNHLLHALPELRWAGVNTSGCTAVITVRPREAVDAPQQTESGDIVSVTDAVITELTVQTGSAMAAPGDAVREGQVLIAGTTDLGLLIRSDRAAGEVYGITSRRIHTVLPETTITRLPAEKTVTRYALLIGKKRVNFSNDSGILHGSCVKMRKVQYLKLPGGFSLPVALVTETYFLCETEQVARTAADAQLLPAARDAVKGCMIAGTILNEQTESAGNSLTAVFECRELIGVFRPGVYLERDTND